MKPADLEKEQAGHKILKITDVTGVWKHQFRMYGGCQGMPVVQDTLELNMYIEKGVQPSRATIERACRASGAGHQGHQRGDGTPATALRCPELRRLRSPMASR